MCRAMLFSLCLPVGHVSDKSFFTRLELGRKKKNMGQICDKNAAWEKEVVKSLCYLWDHLYPHHGYSKLTETVANMLHINISFQFQLMLFPF